MLFEWSDNKNKGNQRKHCVSFEEARTAFWDDFGLRTHDPDHSDDEDRWVLLAMTKEQRLLLIYFTEVDNEIIRIFSARDATKKFVDQYWKRRTTK